MSKQRQSLITQQTQVLISENQFETQEPLVKVTSQQPEKKQRLLSLDVLRGLTVAGMIFVDDLQQGPQWMKHPEWNGFHLADLVFPSFLFILGVAVPLSISKKKPFKLRNLFRIIALFAIGVFLNIFDNKFNFSEFRIMGILQRLALCYGGLCIVHVITNYGQKQYRFIGFLIAIAVGAIYVTFMTTFENIPYGCPHEKNLTPFCNFGSYWDIKIIGKAHMQPYYPNQPQGLFTTLTAFLNAFAGYWFCLIMFQHKNNTKLTVRIWLIIGVLCSLISIPLIWLMPLNKKIWSISYTFLTIGISAISIAIITILVDMAGKNNQKYQKVMGIITAPFLWLGRNPLAIFASHELFCDILGDYIIINNTQAFQHLYHYLFKTWISIDWLASIAFSVFIVLIFVLEAFILFKKNIFIKL